MEESSRLRRKDTTKGPPLRVLSLDGGGVRGFSMLIILQELMHRTFVEIEGRAPKRHEIPKPCDHFDLIAGTGTGGLIAIMLGRLRLDLDTCKDVYVRMTRRVFETDKRILGMPYGGTLYKASKLEEAIRECVKEHTIFEDEGNDALANAQPMSYDSPIAPATPSSGVPQRSISQSSRYSQIGMSPTTMQSRVGFGSLKFGNPNALLYDTRENRTKTAVAAVLKGTSSTVLLRSYDSRKETAPERDCTIWQAGRATAATAMAFKPISVGQSTYLDEGAGKYNPAPTVLDEAVQNEWPGREVGVFVSIGTGKRPAGTNGQQHEWWEGFLGGSMGDWAEARKRMISKLEACEDIHQYMLRDHLAARQVNVENYYRLNVEVGVGELGMNEWMRLSDISTNTRIYLAKRDVEAINQGAAAKMAKIHFAKLRHDRAESRRHGDHPAGRNSWEDPWQQQQQQSRFSGPPPPSNPMAVELPGDETYTHGQMYPPGSQYEHRPSIADQKYTVVSSDSSERYQPHHRPSVTDQKYTVVPDDGYSQHQQPTTTNDSAHRPSTPPQHQRSYSNHVPYISPLAPRHQHSTSGNGPSPRESQDSYQRPSPPPLPPKTPLPYPDQDISSPTTVHSPQSPQFPPNGGGGGPRTFMNMGDLGRRLPYPDVQGPPPAVNTASKPTI